LVDLNHQVTGFDTNLSGKTKKNNVIKGDILDYEHLTESIPSDTDLIIHLAAEHKDEGPSVKDYFRVNELGTSHITKAAIENHVKKILFFSTVGVYGEQICADEKSQLKPINPYGESKVAAEKIILNWSNESAGRSGLIVRPTAVYGPDNRANIYRLIKQASTGMFIMPGDGKHHKSVVYVENVVASCLFLLDHFSPGISQFNLVDEPSIPLNELVAIIRSSSGKSRSVIHVPLLLLKCLLPIYGILQLMKKRSRSLSFSRLDKFGSSSQFDGQKIRNLGFKQPASTEDGIRKTIEWNRKHGWD
jgi:nucleoside-diphosphate-sugar epimerase